MSVSSDHRSRGTCTFVSRSPCPPRGPSQPRRNRQGYAPAESVVRSRSPRPSPPSGQDRRRRGRHRAGPSPHSGAPRQRSAHLSITPQITMSTRPPSATPSPLLAGNGLPIPALRAMTDSQVASAPRLPHLSPLSQCTAHCSAQLFVTHS